MEKETQKYSAAQAAEIVGVTPKRIRQLYITGVIAEEEGTYTGNGLFISEEGVKQAQARRTTIGRPKKDERRKAA
ncbi:MAG: hypothetical protein WA584_23260 [Pyrinomonadaceae bacterium]